MRKTKINLNTLSVKSFVTTFDREVSKTVRGGTISKDPLETGYPNTEDPCCTVSLAIDVDGGCHSTGTTGDTTGVGGGHPHTQTCSKP